MGGEVDCVKLVIGGKSDGRREGCRSQWRCTGAPAACQNEERISTKCVWIASVDEGGDVEWAVEGEDQKVVMASFGEEGFGAGYARPVVVR